MRKNAPNKDVGRFCALGAGIFSQICFHLSTDKLSRNKGGLPVDQSCIDRDTDLLPEHLAMLLRSRMGIAFPFH